MATKWTLKKTRGIEMAQLHRSDLVQARLDDVGEVVLEGLEEVGIEGLKDLLDPVIDGQEQHQFLDDAAFMLLETHRIYQVNTGAALDYIGDGSPFGLVKVMQLASHTGRSDGTEKLVSSPESRSFRLHLTTEERGTVAVIDSGFPAGWRDHSSTWWWTEWLDEAAAGQEDEGRGNFAIPIEPHHAGHGLFVSHLVSRLSGAKVVMAGMAFLDSNLVTVQPNEENVELDELAGHVGLVDELQFYLAVCRLVATGHEFKALNCSFVAEIESQDVMDRPALLMELAVAKWYDHHPDSPIFAAAGNRIPGSQPNPGLVSYPAAIDGVTGVVSSEKPGGALSDFSLMLGESGATCELTATGRDALAISDVSNAVTTWSGTSFACAVATASFVIDNNLPASRVIQLDPRV